MGEIICHHEERYNIYNTISDSFRFVSSIDKDQLTNLIKREQGENGVVTLQDRLARAHERGHSAVYGNSDLEGFLCCNRSGKNEVTLSYEECIKQFLS